MPGERQEALVLYLPAQPSQGAANRRDCSSVLSRPRWLSPGPALESGSAR